MKKLPLPLQTLFAELDQHAAVPAVGFAAASSCAGRCRSALPPRRRGMHAEAPRAGKTARS
jgi:hypothetical protein